MPESGRIPVPLRLCRACRHFVRFENEACDFCGADLAAFEAEYAANQAELLRVEQQLQAALAAIESRDAESRTDDHPGTDRH